MIASHPPLPGLFRSGRSTILTSRSSMAASLSQNWRMSGLRGLLRSWIQFNTPSRSCSVPSPPSSVHLYTRRGSLTPRVTCWPDRRGPCALCKARGDKKLVYVGVHRPSQLADQVFAGVGAEVELFVLDLADLGERDPRVVAQSPLAGILAHAKLADSFAEAHCGYLSVLVSSSPLTVM